MCLKDVEIKTATLKQIQQNINKYSPHPKKVNIIAVTKTLSTKTILNTINNNLFIIGENKIQETTNKIKNINSTRLQVHLIGHLQTNKTKKAVEIYDVIHTADSEKIINKINYFANKINKKQKILIQINITNNNNQYGVHPSKTGELINKTKNLKNIKLIGLMAIGPNTTNENEIKKHYQKTQKIKTEIEQKHKNIKELSMGMSRDYIIALKHGATMIRLGTILFGPRK